MTLLKTYNIVPIKYKNDEKTLNNNKHKNE